MPKLEQGREGACQGELGNTETWDSSVLHQLQAVNKSWTSQLLFPTFLFWSVWDFGGETPHPLPKLLGMPGCQSQVQSDFGNPVLRCWNCIGPGPDNIWDLLPVAATSDILGEWTKTLGAGCWRGQDILHYYSEFVYWFIHITADYCCKCRTHLFHFSLDRLDIDVIGYRSIWKRRRCSRSQD